jgi:hypothetical protein
MIDVFTIMTACTRMVFRAHISNKMILYYYTEWYLHHYTIFDNIWLVLLLLRHVGREVIIRVIDMYKCAVDIWYALWTKLISIYFINDEVFSSDLPSTYCKLSPRSWLSRSAKCSSTTISTSTFNLSPAWYAWSPWMRLILFANRIVMYSRILRSSAVALAPVRLRMCSADVLLQLIIT